MSQNESGVAEAARIVGGQKALGALVGATQQAVAKWCKRGYLPPARVVEVEQATGVPRARLIKPQLASLLDNNIS
jgi:DNA-binding transcriptional regulator YdaS (Cro superfamily)